MNSAFIIGATIGLLGGFHCITMCGPIAAMIHNKSNLKTSVILYNFGRVITYAILGLLMGLLGDSLALFGFQKATSIISGSLIIFIIFMPGILNKLTAISNTGKIISKLRTKLLMIRQSKSPFFYVSTGVLNGFLPCGLVYMALIASVNGGGLLESTVIMIGFGFGTWPLMTLVMVGGGFVKKHLIFKKLIPSISFIIGLLLIVRGLSLDIPFLSPLLSAISLDSGITSCTSQ